MAGDDFGKATDLPFGLPIAAFRDGTPAVDFYRTQGSDLAHLKIHPTEVYGSLWALAVFVGLGLYARKRPPSRPRRRRCS